ncbi:hypothetical protein ANN_22040 [Periplaneta americana]|uniref:Uncharacterized protein n=1 Tax=Periplaneta americana TaxID=6978 RepID=A0ABQ8S719_PERAM|nr:hypothetical protein ANN_22040 [Periplaneta americana]
MAGLCEGGNEPAGSLKAINGLAENRVSHSRQFENTTLHHPKSYRIQVLRHLEPEAMQLEMMFVLIKFRSSGPE